ncbi:uncharacterized protein LOC119670197 [Teleopsis dalmanni]|uniref:uncharacterized protein LOC119670197 n=1 Tax=Teleopsis dalmanni TaxID=139649 RepID=UPI0018CCDAD4|nr:uncharacterized protein LOC119670197 [Teleopsis dalmanni]
MNIEKLITNVRNESCLWDQKHKDFYNPLIRDRLWESIAMELNVNKFIAKDRWNRLRYKYRVLLKQLKEAEEAGKPFTCTWKYFEDMSFIKDKVILTIKYNLTEEQPTSHHNHQLNDSVNGTHSEKLKEYMEHTNENLIQIKVEPNEEEFLSNSESQTDIEENEREDNITMQSKGSKHETNRKECVNSEKDSLLVLEREKHELLESQTDKNKDEDYEFLMSFHQPLKHMNLKDKLLFRCAMQKLLYSCLVDDGYCRS